jgi:hypothetical protein
MKTADLVSGTAEWNRVLAQYPEARLYVKLQAKWRALYLRAQRQNALERSSKELAAWSKMKAAFDTLPMELRKALVLWKLPAPDGEAEPHSRNRAASRPFQAASLRASEPAFDARLSWCRRGIGGDS